MIKLFKMDKKPLFYSFNQYLKKRYPFRVRKIPIDAGFTCPNRDGYKSRGGCIYCENRSFSPTTGIRELGNLGLKIKDQIIKGMEFYKKNFRAEKFIAYFQTFSNTYAPVDTLKKIYDQALGFSDIIAIAIGTRPDCVPDNVLDLIASYSEKVNVYLEIGLQSMHNSTLKSINRQHTYEDFLDAVNRAKKRNLNICAHIILGLPDETRKMMMQTALEIKKWGIDGLKIHHLYVAKNTPLEELYSQGKIKLFTLPEFVKLVADVLEVIPSNIVIERLVGELTSPYLIAPRWGKSKTEIIRYIEMELENRNSYQGKLCADEIKDNNFEYKR